ncbi:hypothetical protein [Salmonella phage SD-15_S21]|nr:hypothetical protein [Salmonella phage SD-15_S21]
MSIYFQIVLAISFQYCIMFYMKGKKFKIILAISF